MCSSFYSSRVADRVSCVYATAHALSEAHHCFLGRTALHDRHSYPLLVLSRFQCFKHTLALIFLAYKFAKTFLKTSRPLYRFSTLILSLLRCALSLA
jgi:hypothetical protein